MDDGWDAQAADSLIISVGSPSLPQVNFKVMHYLYSHKQTSKHILVAHITNVVANSLLRHLKHIMNTLQTLV